MGRYLCSDTVVLRFPELPDPIVGGQVFERDFSDAGPEGRFGPEREAALLQGGAMTVAPPEPPAAVAGGNDVNEDRPSRKKKE